MATGTTSDTVGPVCKRIDSGGAEVFVCQLCSVFTAKTYQRVLTHIGKCIQSGVARLFVCRYMCIIFVCFSALTVICTYQWQILFNNGHAPREIS